MAGPTIRDWFERKSVPEITARLVATLRVVRPVSPGFRPGPTLPPGDCCSEVGEVATRLRARVITTAASERSPVLAIDKCSPGTYDTRETRRVGENCGMPGFSTP